LNTDKLYSEQTIELLTGSGGLGMSYLEQLGTKYQTETLETPYINVDIDTQTKVIDSFLWNLRKPRADKPQDEAIALFVDYIFGKERNKYPRTFAEFENKLRVDVTEAMTSVLKFDLMGIRVASRTLDVGERRVVSDKRCNICGNLDRECGQYPHGKCKFKQNGFANLSSLRFVDSDKGQELQRKFGFTAIPMHWNDRRKSNRYREDRYKERQDDRALDDRKGSDYRRNSNRRDDRREDRRDDRREDRRDTAYKDRRESGARENYRPDRSRIGICKKIGR
jgi:hypothetical protein